MWRSIAGLAGVNLISAAANTLVASYMNHQRAPAISGGEPVRFNHPFVQSMLEMLGMALCLVTFLFTLRRGRDAEEAS